MGFFFLDLALLFREAEGAARLFGFVGFLMGAGVGTTVGARGGIVDRTGKSVKQSADGVFGVGRYIFSELS